MTTFNFPPRSISTLTPLSAALFRELVRSAPDWNGNPLFEGDKTERGNLTDLKKLGLVTTFAEDHCTFVSFTETGEALAKEISPEYNSWVEATARRAEELK